MDGSLPIAAATGRAGGALIRNHGRLAMRAFAFVAITMIVGFAGGVFYGKIFGSPPQAPQTDAVAGQTDKKAEAKRNPNAIAAAASRRYAEKREMRLFAQDFFSELDDYGCTLEPAALERFSDAARFSMEYRLPDGTDRKLEMSGADYKSFGMNPEAELGLDSVDCRRQGRIYQVGNGAVRVHEERILDAFYRGQTVEIRQTRVVVVGLSEDGDWMIQELTGRARIE